MKSLVARLLGNKSSPIGHDVAVQRIGDYSIVRKLGSGGTSDVYLGLHHKTMATAAIKQLSSRCSTDAHRQMFLTESLLCGMLDHPNVIHLYGSSFSDPSATHLIMEYVEGCSLEQHEHPDSLLPVEKVVEVIRQAAEGLRYLAQEGVIHRDIKPGNILLRKDGRVKISDFGCAILQGLPHAALRVAGSLPYMSPEQITGKPMGPLSDMYSLGVVFYRLLTGHHPVEAKEGEDAPSYARRIINSLSIPVEHLRPELPTGVAAVVERMLSKDVADRYESWDVFLHALHCSMQTRLRHDDEFETQWKSFRLQREKTLPDDFGLSFGF